MVLRGSKVRPESSLDDSEDAVHRARSYLRQVNAAIRQADDERTNDLKKALGNIERRESHGERVSPDELHNIVRVLVEKIDALEQRRDDAEIRLKETEENMRATILQLVAGGQFLFLFLKQLVLMIVRLSLFF